MSIPHPIRSRRNNEELFFEYYAQINGWASQLARFDRTEAEDLVQDFYIQLTRSSVAMADMDELEPYLFKVLRNLHYSRLRRQGSSPIHDLSIADYSTIEWGLAAADRQGLFLVRADLTMICEFICQRKQSSRAASVFLLRFFLGYFPSEVMKVTQTSRVGVDKSLQFARREVQLHLKSPSASRPSSRSGQASMRPAGVYDDSHALFLQLRQIIAGSCEGDCFDPADLKQRYEEGLENRFTVEELAHLVACRRCLDRVNDILGLPPLEDRWPDDAIGRDNPPTQGGGDSSRLTVHRGAKQKATVSRQRALERRAREVFEHRPESLEVMVNGDLRSSQRVTAEVSELHLKLNRAEEPGFIEVFSEQGVRLAYLHVMEPTLCPGLEQRERIAFSDGRLLELTLSFADGLSTVHVVYSDTLFGAMTAMAAEAGDEPEMMAWAPNFDVAVARLKPGPALRFPLAGWISACWDQLSLPTFPRMNPLFASALLLGFGSVICFFLWLRSAPLPSARDFLKRAQMQEANMGAHAEPGVIIQKVRIKTPAQTTERTLYRDVQHRRHVRERSVAADTAKLRARLSIAGIDWNDPLSASTYFDWHNHLGIRKESVKRTDPNRLTITTSVSEGAVLSESLTVRASDFHAVSKTIELRDYGTVEIAEIDYNVIPWSSVNPDLFDPLPHVSSDSPKPGHAAILPRALRLASPAELDEAELGAKLVLNRLQLDNSSRIELTRQPNGVLVQGVVEDEEQKRRLRAQLNMVPHVSASVQTIQEMTEHLQAGSDVTSIRQSSIAAAEPSALERYFAAQGMDRTAAGSPVRELEDSSFEVRRQSRQIADLLRRFSSDKDLTSASRISLSELIVQQKAALLEALSQEDRQLIALGLVSLPAFAGQNVQDDAVNLPGIAERNFTLCAELISENNASPRSAQEIASQLAASIAYLRAVVLHVSAADQMHPPPSADTATPNQN